MKIDENDIRRAAHDIRDKQNMEMNVRPWHKTHLHIPHWLIAVPAAAVVGFMIGFSLNKELPSAEPSAIAKIDTIYIKEKAQIDNDSMIRQEEPITEKKKTATVYRKKTYDQTEERDSGQPICSDNIQYDLIVNR